MIIDTEYEHGIAEHREAMEWMLAGAPKSTGRRYGNQYEMLDDLAEVQLSRIQTDELFTDAELQHCYFNCWKIVSDYTGYTYCEGIAMRMGMLVNHAWLLDEHGRILDPTWSLLENGPVTATYQGIQFADEFLFEHGIANGWVSFIAADWRLGHPAITRGFRFDDNGRACDYGPLEEDE